LQEIAEQYNIIHIAAPAASNDITGINFVPNSFRTSRNNYQDAISLCQYLAAQPNGLVQIAPDASFGRTTAGFYRDACRYFGGHFAADDIFAPASSSDFTPYVQQIRDSGAGALIVTWAGPGYVPLLQALADEGIVDQMNVTVSFPDNASIPALLGDIVGETGGIVYHYTSPSNEINDWLVSKTIARHGAPPDLFGADGMSAALMIAEAITVSGGDASADALIAAMEGLEFTGPKGTVSIRSEDHVALQDMYIVRLTNVDDPEARFFELVTSNRPEPPCLLPVELKERCRALPIGSLMRPVYLPLISRR
ncbi:MAG: ABC transporter substrate-binding protein, partial [Anderseniella sp.]|nr:ABC transporter substrate-binding protein [Anderseniella sp.]